MERAHGAASYVVARITDLARGVYWRDMGVANLPSGRLSITLSNGAARRLADMTPTGYKPINHVSLTDDFPLAQAFVVISAVPEGIGDSGSGEANNP